MRITPSTHGPTSPFTNLRRPQPLLDPPFTNFRRPDPPDAHRASSVGRPAPPSDPLRTDSGRPAPPSDPSAPTFVVCLLPPIRRAPNFVENNRCPSSRPSENLREPIASDPAALPDNRAAWETLHPTLQALDPKSALPLRGNLQLAAVAALGTAAYVARPEVRARFTLLSKVGLFDPALLDALPVAARAAIYANHVHKLTTAAESNAKVSADLDAQSKELRDRMFDLVEHTLRDDADIARRIKIIRPGTGYIDRANDLTALADIYRERPARVRLDGTLFREKDEAAARKLAGDIFTAFGLGKVVNGVDWYDEQHRAWVHFEATYREIARWGHALDADASPDELYPDLHGASRSPARPRRPAPEATTEPAATGDAATPTKKPA